MHNLTIAYAIYLVLTAGITIFVANYLFKNGKTFLMNAFNGNELLVKAINNLLKMGFYLVNIGYAFSTITIRYQINSTEELIRTLAVKIGSIILILGVMHFFNMFILYMFGGMVKKKTATPKVQEF